MFKFLNAQDIYNLYATDKLHIVFDQKLFNYVKTKEDIFDIDYKLTNFFFNDVLGSDNSNTLLQSKVFRILLNSDNYAPDGEIKLKKGINILNLAVRISSDNPSLFIMVNFDHPDTKLISEQIIPQSSFSTFTSVAVYSSKKQTLKESNINIRFCLFN